MDWDVKVKRCFWKQANISHTCRVCSSVQLHYQPEAVFPVSDKDVQLPGTVGVQSINTQYEALYLMFKHIRCKYCMWYCYFRPAAFNTWLVVKCSCQAERGMWKPTGSCFPEKSMKHFLLLTHNSASMLEFYKWGQKPSEKCNCFVTFVTVTELNWTFSDLWVSGLVESPSALLSTLIIFCSEGVILPFNGQINTFTVNENLSKC